MATNLFGFVSNEDFIIEMEKLIKALGGSVLIEKTITQNGVYNAIDDNADGYSKVTVTIPKSIGAPTAITSGISSSAIGLLVEEDT